ncbi:hypothetical protein F4861DRAFT_361216 [Xylaria intraflava]|nr:hypothetical protein F4861DRAFT_361216 [Xylaria intraflava]
MAPLLPTIAAQARKLLVSAIGNYSSDPLSKLGPLAARAVLLARDGGDDNKDGTKEPQLDPSSGVTDPNDINNTFIFILFGLIGVALVITGIWFFFWAKNGGFHFKENDWDDYKSTVLRRKGPNGTILSNATPSTDLGGGSIYKDMDDSRTQYTGGLTEMTGHTRDTGDTGSTMTGITAGASDIAGRERRRRAREKKERSGHKKSRSSKVGETEADTLRAYRHERSARVGGLNKESEASEWEGSTNPEMSTVAGSEPLLPNRQTTPTKAKFTDAEQSYHEAASEITNDSQNRAAGSSSKTGGIRKVYSRADRKADRLRTAGPSSSSSQNTALQRNYSYQRAGLRSSGSAIPEDQETSSFISPTERASGRYLPAPLSRVAESDADESSDVGTKSYRHYIPGLSSSSGAGTSAVGTDYTEDRRERRERREKREKGKKRDTGRN